jgi:hypothetical protein
MAVGSVPHADATAAMQLMLRYTPDILAWPQLPQRSFLEQMYVQFSEGLPGRIIDASEEVLSVEDEVPPEELMEFLEALESGDLGRFAVSPEYAAGLGPLEEVLAQAAPAFVKGQVVGPVSFGLAVTTRSKKALLYDQTMLEVVTALVKAKALWQEALLRAWGHRSEPVVVFDEPYLTQLGSGFVSLPVEAVYPPLSECMGALSCLVGIHVCGGTDWAGIVERLPVDLLSFDAADHLDSALAHAGALTGFVAQGGLIAWGAVPNDERAWDLSPETVAAAVREGAQALSAAPGLSVATVLSQSFVSPACGTGTLSEELAERCFALCHATSQLLREEL